MTMQLLPEELLSEVGHPVKRPVQHRGGYMPEFSSLAERVQRLLTAEAASSQRSTAAGQYEANGRHGASARQRQLMSQQLDAARNNWPTDELAQAGSLAGRRMVRTTPPMPTPAEASTLLSPCEEEIVWLVAQGCPDKLIADKLAMSYWTVGSYLRRIFAKLAVNSRVEMVAVAVKQLGDGVL